MLKRNKRRNYRGKLKLKCCMRRKSKLRHGKRIKL